MLKLQEVADLLNVGKRTLERWIAKGAFPLADLSPNARIKRWLPSTIRAWVDRNGGPSVLPLIGSSNGCPIKSSTKRKAGTR